MISLFLGSHARRVMDGISSRWMSEKEAGSAEEEKHSTVAQ